MMNEKLLEVLSHPADGEVAIVTQGIDGPHVVNTWNSYVKNHSRRENVNSRRQNERNRKKYCKATIWLSSLSEAGKFRD